MSCLFTNSVTLLPFSSNLVFETFTSTSSKFPASFTASAIKESTIAFVSLALVKVVSIFPCHKRSVACVLSSLTPVFHKFFILFCR